MAIWRLMFGSSNFVFNGFLVVWIIALSGEKPQAYPLLDGLV
jgi:hypothetical protein